MRRYACGLITAVAALTAGRADAAPVVFTFTGTGTGTLGNQGFRDTDFNISVLGDTSSQLEVNPGVFMINATSASVSIDGIGLADFTTATRVFNNENNEVAGFSRAGVGGVDILDLRNSLFANYDLTTDFDPVAGVLTYLNTFNLTTTLGNFDLSAASNLTFQAEVEDAPAVPEPTTLALMGLGGLGLVGGALRKRRQAPAAAA